MSLFLLLDENISQVIAAQVKYHRPALVIESVHSWKEGAFEGRPDKSLLQAACAEALTLVTYDKKTIPPLLVELDAEEEHHAGVIFVDDRTISNDDFGTLARALIFLWERFGEQEWQDRMASWKSRVRDFRPPLPPAPLVLRFEREKKNRHTASESPHLRCENRDASPGDKP